MADRVGQQVGNYRLIRRLGYGGFAEVYLGQHIYLEKFAAIKILHAQLGAADMESFRQEARTIANLEHPHIVRILEFGIQQQDYTPYLVMDYAPNGSLRERYTRGSAAPLPTIVSYVNQVASALQYAHERNLIHRDVKPENMLVGQNNTILLSDFGIALIAQSSRSQSMQDVVGSVSYMAPEQLQGRPRFASDQYSLGISVYEWLCGDRPFHGSFTEIGSQHIFTPPPLLREKIPALSPAIEEVVMVALAKDYQRRFANMQAFASAFEQACRSQASMPPMIVSPPVAGPLSASLPPTVAGTPSASVPPTIAGSPSASLLPGAARSPTPSLPPAAGSSVPYAYSQTNIPTYQHTTQGITQPASYQQTPPTNPSGQPASYQQVSPTILSGPPPDSFVPGTMPAPRPKKGPNVGLLIGTVVLVIALIAGGFFVFGKGNSGNQGASTLTPGASSTSNSGTVLPGRGGTAPISGGATATAAATLVKVALVTDIGGLNDGGFNQLAYTGYENARKQYGFPEVIIQSQTVSDSEYERNLNAAANQADMVIGIGFDMETAITKVAQQFPNKKFAIVDGCAVDANFNCVNMSNVAPLFFKEQEAGCLVGAIAGKMEVDGKSQVPKLLGRNTIAAIGGLAIPPVVRYIAGYKYCAQKVDPGINVVVGYSQNFTDPTSCSTIASNLITNNQADILFQVAGGCGIGVLDAATQHNVYSIGVDANQSKDVNGVTRPSVITSAVKRVDTAVFDIIQLAQMSTFANYVNNPFTFDVAHNGVGFAIPSSDVPQDAVQAAMNFANEIKSGALVPPEVIP